MPIYPRGQTTQHPKPAEPGRPLEHCFGKAACISSTFGYRDDFFDRVRHEDRRNVTFYLDSGWPEDNFEPTQSMRDLLAQRGYRFGR